MRFRDRPLLPDGLDAGLYVERPGLEEAVFAPLAEGRNVLLLGEAGSGKSTLLRRTANRMVRDGRPAVIVNAAPAADAVELLELVDGALREHVGGGEDEEPAQASARRATSLLAAARGLRRERPVTILVDGLLDPAVGYDVFGRLRDELWELGHAWAVAVRPRDSAPLRTPPADAFWGAVVEIGQLSYAETEQLLRRGLDDDEYRLVDSVGDKLIAGAYPRTTIRAAQEVLAGNGPAETGGAPRSQQLAERASELGRSEAMAMAELQGLGHPVSAHDPELLGRLGWSRPYAQRMLSKLEDEGLLRSIPDRSGDRPGRPRKLYEPNPTPPA